MQTCVCTQHFLLQGLGEKHLGDCFRLLQLSDFLSFFPVSRNQFLKTWRQQSFLLPFFPSPGERLVPVWRKYYINFQCLTSSVWCQQDCSCACSDTWAEDTCAGTSTLTLEFRSGVLFWCESPALSELPLFHSHHRQVLKLMNWINIKWNQTRRCAPGTHLMSSSY